VTNEQFNQLFTMHGAIMLLLFATPLFVGFTNVIMPLQIGSPDVAFPRLNMFSYWLFLFGGLIVVGGFFTPEGAASFGWFAYAPLNDAIRSPGIGSDMWIMDLVLSGFSTILSGVNFITTVICMRAPGMTMFRMPIFTWNILLTSVLVLMAFPVLAAALLALRRTASLAPTSSTRRMAARFCGSTCFGSSGIPRSISSRCRSSASSARSCPCSAGSRSSVTRDWSSQRSRSPGCR
jgi:heme/copper-type cytochrome/quinol oxidase subunit 1